MDNVSLAVYIFSIVGMAVVATAIAISRHSRSKLFFTATVYTSCLWLLIQYVVQMYSIKGILGLQLIQLTSAISFAIAIFFYCFSCSYINKSISKMVYVIFCVIFVLELVMNMSGLMIQEAWGEPAGLVVDKASNFYLVYIALIGMIFVAAIYDLIKVMIKTESKKDRARDRLLIIGFFQAVVVLVIGNTFFKSSAEIQMVIPISLFVMSVMVGLAIVKYQLFDVKLAVIRTFAYVLSLTTLSIVYYGLAYGISVILFHGHMDSSFSISPINIVLALVLAFLFQPIKNFFDKVTNKFFYKDIYDTNEFYARLNRTLTSTTDLRGLLERVANEIATTLKSEQAFFFIHTSNNHFINAGTDHYAKMPRSDALELQIVHEMNYGLFIASLRDENDPVRRLMVSHGIELILPLKQASIIGYLCLGEHMTSRYTSRDIKVLNTIADELVIAIQNALAVQEIREFNVTLQQRINNATRELRTSNMMLRRLDKIKDEFVSIASHQLRTPLTSVKGYISMILDGDAGGITDTQRELLNEAYISSERMVHLISDFLNVSRLQTGKFIIDKKPTDLSKVVSEEIDSLRPSAASRNMEFVYNHPKNFPLLDIDDGKIRQVIMNFADNSMYYSEEGTKIRIDLSVEGNEILFTVKDTGIGVPKNEQAQLFTKFYRASNAKSKRPDGTGVGLFLAKKVIDAHHGQIVFESTEGKGSTFGFRLPIAENKPTSLELAERSQQS